MTIPTAGTPAPGWYPDPTAAGRSRWWDGNAWSDQYGPPVAASPASTGYTTPIPAAKRPWYSSPWKVIGLIVGAAVAVLVVLGVLAALGSASKTYKGTDLANDVRRVLSDNGVTVSSVTCDTGQVVKGEATSCVAYVDGKKTGIRVTWDDNNGHFHLDEETPQ